MNLFVQEYLVCPKVVLICELVVRLSVVISPKVRLYIYIYIYIKLSVTWAVGRELFSILDGCSL